MASGEDALLAAPIRWGVVIHGGVGVLPRDRMPPELEAGYRRDLAASLEAGHRALAGGGSALDAVVAAVEVMEDSPHFNAGRGSSLNAEGAVSMDASIMEGESLRAGAVTGVRRVKNPIHLARAVLEHCPHVFLSGAGAEEYARERRLEEREPAWFITERRRRELEEAREREAQGILLPDSMDPPGSWDGGGSGATSPGGSGTVGAVALDPAGRLVAGTSTGGSANKRWGRIGDSPVIGAGTYAGSHCGVSCTGWGEYFIRNAVAHDLQARMAYQGVSLGEAARELLEVLEGQRKGLGGVVALDRQGNVEMGFNTLGMYRGYVDQEGRAQVAIYR